MKKFTTLALAGAMSMAMVATAFAADPLLTGSTSGGASGRPTDEAYVVDTTSLSDEERASIASAEFTFTIDSDFMNGGGGYNANGADWTQPEGYEFKTSGTSTYVMPIENYALGEDGTDSLQVQTWWLNAKEDGSDATFTLDSVVLKDASGNVLLTVGGASEPAGDVAPVAYLAAAAALAGLALVATKKKLA